MFCSLQDSQHVDSFYSAPFPSSTLRPVGRLLCQVANIGNVESPSPLSGLTQRRLSIHLLTNRQFRHSVLLRLIYSVSKRRNGRFNSERRARKLLSLLSFLHRYIFDHSNRGSKSNVFCVFKKFHMLFSQSRKKYMLKGG